jgi:Ion channel
MMIAVLIGVLVVLLALWDGFEVMVLPRRVTRRWRLARFYYRYAWRLWRSLCRRLPAGRYRENALSIFGPLSLLGLFVCWLGVLITGFALMHWGGHTLPGDAGGDFRQCLYHSGETLFTLGYGDVTPASYPGKLLSVAEAGTGFGFMAIIIGYLPVLYQAFSRREQSIALLDARAGSPPTASELFRRSGHAAECQEVKRFLAEWEAWAAELLESHLSFPVLAYYRSQHDNQSWLSALAVALDSSSVLMVAGNDSGRRRAELTFAMARHTCVDLCLIFWLPPVESMPERLTAAELERLHPGPDASSGWNQQQVEHLRDIRALYEPFLQALSNHFWQPLPRFFPERPTPDNWQTSAWTGRAPGITELPAARAPARDHFG